MSDTTLATRNSAPAPGIIEQVVVGGDLEKLTPAQRVSYYRTVCESLGINPYTKPFAYLRLNNKLVLYAQRDATDQLRKLHRVSITIVGREKVEDLYVVTARATTPDGRTDESIGAVNLTAKRGDDLANALMKAETKAKRRVTLSICGLGWIDETETETVRDAVPVRVDHTTGEIVVDDADFSPPIGQQAAEPAAKAPAPSVEFIFGSELREDDPAPADDAPVDPDAPITPAQSAEVYKIVAHRLGYNANHVVDLLQQRYKVNTRKNLTHGQAEDFLAYLNTQLPKA